MRDRDGTGRYLSTGEVARHLGISRFTLLRAVRRGAIQPAQQTPGGYYRFDLATVQEYATRLAQPTAPQPRSTSQRPTEYQSRDVRREERLSTLFATMASGVLVLAADGHLSDVNDAARHLLGLQNTACGDHVLGRVLAQTRDAHGAALPSEERPIQRALATGQPQRNVVVGITRRDGVECCASRAPPSPGFANTCSPSPCTRLSRAQTTMRAPLPWGSRPVGNLAFLGRQTC